MDVVPTENDFGAFLRGVYGWMFLGLLLTTAVAFVISLSPSLTQAIIGNPFIFYGLIVVELVLVFILSSRVRSMSPWTATCLFLFYSVLNGATLTFIFIAYTDTSIMLVFAGAAVMFGVISLYGYITKRNLTGIGHFAGMALIGLIVASLINLFFASHMLVWIISWAGIIIFTILTAYDTQRLQQLYNGTGPGVNERSVSILGALKLYLDFINLFLDLLRIFGRVKEE